MTFTSFLSTFLILSCLSVVKIILQGYPGKEAGQLGVDRRDPRIMVEGEHHHQQCHKPPIIATVDKTENSLGEISCLSKYCFPTVFLVV